MGCLWYISKGCPWFFIDMSKGFPWYFYDISLVFPWNSCLIFVGFQKNSYVSSLVFLDYIVYFSGYISIYIYIIYDFLLFISYLFCLAGHLYACWILYTLLVMPFAKVLMLN